MDLSKLPRLSHTPAPPAAATGDSGPPPAAEAGQGSEPAMFCRCGAPLVAGAKFCSSCGASYAEATGTSRTPPIDMTDIWISALFSLAIGLFLLLWMPTGVKYWTAAVTGRNFTPYDHPVNGAAEKVDFTRWNISTPTRDPDTGQVVMLERTVDIKYRDKFDHFWADTALTMFAIALVLQGLLLAAVRNHWAMLGAGVLIAAAAGFNLWYVIASYTLANPLTGAPYGFAPMQAIAVIGGGLMAAYQFRLARELAR